MQHSPKRAGPEVSWAQSQQGPKWAGPEVEVGPVSRSLCALLPLDFLPNECTGCLRLVGKCSRSKVQGLVKPAPGEGSSVARPPRPEGTATHAPRQVKPLLLHLRVYWCLARQILHYLDSKRQRDLKGHRRPFPSYLQGRGRDRKEWLIGCLGLYSAVYRLPVCCFDKIFIHFTCEITISHQSIAMYI